MVEKITQAELRAALDYDPATGLFRWRLPRKKVRVGDVAGRVREDGHRVICVNRRQYLASHLAWLYMTGSWPDPEVDHRDKNPSNDAWENLREATRQQQCFNRRVRSDSTTGIKGVVPYKDGFKALIYRGGKAVTLGIFKNKDKAARAYQIAASNDHGEFASW